MKKSLSLVLITLLFVILGCSLDKFTGGGDDAVPTPVPSTDTTSSSGNADSTDSDSTEKLPSDDTASSAASGDASMDKFNKIEMDMSYEQVKDIMGSEGNQTSSSQSGNFESAAYQWKGDKNVSIRASFQNGKLTSKSQAGITPNDGTADISQAKFNKVETGMNYDEVKDILGSAGELTRMSKYRSFSTSSYTWKGNGFSRIMITFKDGKLQNKNQANLK